RVPGPPQSTLFPYTTLFRSLSIVTPKPQTTRKNVSAVLTKEDTQIIFLDTPGILRPRYEMQRSMMRFLDESLEAADVICVLWDLDRKSTRLNSSHVKISYAV